MDLQSVDLQSFGMVGLGALIMLVGVLGFAVSLGRAAWGWARGHLGTFEQLQATTKDGKIQITASIRDQRVKPEPQGAEVLSLSERRRESEQA